MAYYIIHNDCEKTGPSLLGDSRVLHLFYHGSIRSNLKSTGKSSIHITLFKKPFVMGTGCRNQGVASPTTLPESRQSFSQQQGICHGFTVIKTVNYGFTPYPYVQFQIYHEALLMFYAKVSVYLKALQKSVNDQWQTGIG